MKYFTPKIQSIIFSSNCFAFPRKRTNSFFMDGRNNTREEISYFLTCVDIVNQLLTRHSPLTPLSKVDEWTAKPSRFSIQVVCRSFLKSWRLNTKKSVSLTDSEVQTFLEGEENQYTKRKTESCVFSGFGVSISLGWEWKSTTGRFATGRFWPFTSLTRELSSYTLEEKFHICARPCIILFSFATVPTMRKMLRVTLRPLLRAPLENTSASGVPSLYIIIVIIIILLFITIIFLWSLFELSVLLGYYS